MASCTSAFEAMGHFAGRALMILQVLVLKGAEIVAVVRAAFEVASWVTSLHNHFPLKSLPSFHLLLVQEHFEVILSLESVLAACVRAPDRQFAHIDLCTSILSQTLRVVKVLAGGDTVNGPFLVIFVEERHEANLTVSVS